MGLFGRIKIWRTAELKVVSKKKFGEWIDFSQLEAIKFGWFEFDESRTICQTFLLPKVSTIQYMYMHAVEYMQHGAGR